MKVGPQWRKEVSRDMSLDTYPGLFLLLLCCTSVCLNMSPPPHDITAMIFCLAMGPETCCEVTKD